MQQHSSMEDSEELDKIEVFLAEMEASQIRMRADMRRMLDLTTRMGDKLDKLLHLRQVTCGTPPDLDFVRSPMEHCNIAVEAKLLHEDRKEFLDVLPIGDLSYLNSEVPVFQISLEKEIDKRNDLVRLDAFSNLFDSSPELVPDFVQPSISFISNVVATNVIDFNVVSVQAEMIPEDTMDFLEETPEVDDDVITAGEERPDGHHMFDAMSDTASNLKDWERPYACHLFDEMSDKDVMSYYTMISNHTVGAAVLSHFDHKFDLMCSTHTLVHWYVNEGMVEGEFSEMMKDVQQLLLVEPLASVEVFIKALHKAYSRVYQDSHYSSTLQYKHPSHPIDGNCCMHHTDEALTNKTTISAFRVYVVVAQRVFDKMFARAMMCRQSKIFDRGRLLDIGHHLFKEGNINMESLQFKSKFLREVLLCRVGDFYEAVAFDAFVLVAHAGLNPFGGLRSDSVPRAGCPALNLRQTRDDLTRSGFSVCIVEEVQGPSLVRCHKGQFISDHAHPGNPYVHGLAAVDHDVDFPEPMPVVAISRYGKGYCMYSVLETVKTYSAEDGLSEEAIDTKLRTCQYHHLFLHTSLRKNSSGMSCWGEFGEGGLLWGECSGKSFEWFDGIPLEELLCNVRENYGLDQEATFQNVTVPSDMRPQPLGTATQIGVIPTEGIPSLLKVLLPTNYANLVKLLASKEANHIAFCRIKNIADGILQMHKHSELSGILHILLEPTWVATGLSIEYELLVNECGWISQKIYEISSVDNEEGQEVSSFEFIPEDFCKDMEASWKGCVKRIHAKESFQEVDKAAEALSVAVMEDFVPIISRVKSLVSSLGGPKGEVCYAKEYEAVWFKGKCFMPTAWANTPGEEQIKQLRSATDSRGRNVGEEWSTTNKVAYALNRYHEASDIAKNKVLELLRGLSAELQTKINILVFFSMLLVIAKKLLGHVSEVQRRKWVFPTLCDSPQVQGNAIQNTVQIQSQFLLTEPNGGGKSSLLRSICATALLGICGVMIELSEVRSLVTSATERSLVLVEELCRGTETAKGTCIAGSIVETLDQIGRLCIVSTHLHGIFDLPLTTQNTMYKAMGTEVIDGKKKPIWELIDGVCRESLAFQTAQREGFPEAIIRRAEELYFSMALCTQSGTLNASTELFTEIRKRDCSASYDSMGSAAGISPGIMQEMQKEVLLQHFASVMRTWP